MMWFKLATAFTLFLLQSAVFGQVTGVVAEETEEGKYTPLAGANVIWAGTTTGTVTDTEGRFQLKPSPTTTQLVISYIGFGTDTVDVKDMSEVSVILKMQSLNEFTVEARKGSVEISYMSPLLTQNITEKELFKAACCNLSESFETNPSVDVSFTDAITGTRQIRMLGLSGRYSMIAQENMPGTRGLASVEGLEYIPGSWIESIQLTKGAGTVINGYESIAGQINIELKKPADQKFFLNGYVNQSGRTELNLNLGDQKIGKHWSSALLLHGAIRPLEIDNNGDGFLDMPLTEHFIGMNRWKYFNGDKGIMGQIGVKAIALDNRSGQLGYDFNVEQLQQNLYGVQTQTRRIEGFTKTGIVFKNQVNRSLGLQTRWVYHQHNATFGTRDYSGNQKSAYANLIYQTILGSTDHNLKLGSSFMYDEYDEQYVGLDFDRTEIVPGAFAEYSFDQGNRFNLVAGIRGDYHNLFGFFATPRLHTRYAITEKTVVRASVGRGQRTANIFADNIGAFVSSRQLTIQSNSNSPAYGLDPEVAWNMGFSVNHSFRLDYRDGLITIDAFRTYFQNQVVADVDYHPSLIVFYNLDGESYANSVQAQVDYEIWKRLDLRLAYRWYDVKVDYLEGRLSQPLLAEHRAFANIAYETRSKWFFDFTVQWQGPKRIPGTNENPEQFQLNDQSPELWLMNAQITKSVGKLFDAYVGCENITNFRQPNPILAANEPFGPHFDSSLVWGPIFGRTIYFGFRLTVKHESPKE